MNQRTFKTRWFARSACKAHIADEDLRKAIGQVALGQADDMGGGVFKKRLNDNRHRSIIIAMSGAKGRRFWVFEYLFAKKDRANVESDELASFRNLAKAYSRLTDQQIDQLVRDGQFEEIFHEE